MTNYFEKFFADCNNLLSTIETTKQNYFAAIADDIRAKRHLKEVEEQLESAEAEIVAEAAITAKAGTDSPLAGLAATSPAYKAAIDALKSRERSAGRTAQIYAHVVRCRNEADEAQIIREQTGADLSACKAAADLRSSMLRPFQTN